MKRNALGACMRSNQDGTNCGAHAIAVAVVQWSGERIPACGSHLARLRRRLGSGVTVERAPAPELTPTSSPKETP